MVHQSDFAKVLPRLDPGYDIVFFDGYAPTPKVLKLIMTLLKTRGLLISANQTLGGKDTDAYRALIMDQGLLAHGLHRPGAGDGAEREAVVSPRRYVTR